MIVGKMDSKSFIILEEPCSIPASPSKTDYTSWSLESFHSFERSLKFKETEVTESGEEEVE